MEANMLTQLQEDLQMLRDHFLIMPIKVSAWHGLRDLSTEDIKLERQLDLQEMRS